MADKPNTVVVPVKPRSLIAVLAKRAVQLLFLVFVTPRLFGYWIGSLLWDKNRAFLAASESIGRVPGMRGVFARQAFYRVLLSHCGKDVYFGWQSVFSMREASVGDNAYIGRRCGIGFGHIGANVMLADGVQILSGGREHGIAGTNDGTHQEQVQSYVRVVVENGAWLGTNAVVMADVGRATVVGAGAVVTKPIPPRSVCVGVPARVVKRLGSEKSG